MKKIAILLACIAITGITFAQVGRGTYGTVQPISVQQGTAYNRSLVARTTGFDTLRGVDTAYVYFNFSKLYKLTFDLKTTQKADSFSGAAILQAADANGSWQSITGLTSLCTTCVGASKTFTLQTGTVYTLWDLGLMESFSNYRLRIVGTRSTDTTILSATANYGY